MSIVQRFNFFTVSVSQFFTRSPACACRFFSVDNLNEFARVQVSVMSTIGSGSPHASQVDVAYYV